MLLAFKLMLLLKILQLRLQFVHLVAQFLDESIFDVGVGEIKLQGLHLVAD